MADILSIARSGVTAYQRSLATVGNNISNVNTDGYSRQRVDLVPRTSTPYGSGFIGNGVQVETVRRVYDQFLNDEVAVRTSTFGQADILYNFAAQVDNVLASENSSLSPAIQSFFDAVQGVANDPTSIPAREVMISEATTLSIRFRQIDDEFQSLRDQVNSQLEVMTAEISSIASNIAQLNRDIGIAQSAALGQPANDLLDKRDQQVRRLAELVSVNTVPAENGAINVFIGNGLGLVMGTEYATLGTRRGDFDPAQLQVVINNSYSSVPASSQLTGGEMGGILDFRRTVLDPAQDGLGRIALGLASTFNDQHQLGDDLNGNPGGLFFRDVAAVSPKVFANVDNDPASGTVSVSISDATALKASEYQLTYDGTNFSLLRLSDNTVVDSGFGTGSLPRTVAGEGITIDLAGSVASGDSFLIRPVRYGGRDMDVAIGSAAEVAAAASGNPVGDNSNALALANLQTQKLLGGGTETYQAAYGRVLTDVGIKTREAEVNRDAQQALLDNAVAAQSAVSGVNLDEEAADLIKYQQAYQASAQLMRIADTLFQTLLNMAGR